MEGGGLSKGTRLQDASPGGFHSAVRAGGSEAANAPTLNLATPWGPIKTGALACSQAACYVATNSRGNQAFTVTKFVAAPGAPQPLRKCARPGRSDSTMEAVGEIDGVKDT